METNNKPDIVKFLCGELDYNGVWFGDAIAGKTFWWRSVLRDTIEERDANIAELEIRLETSHKVSELLLQSENQALKSELEELNNSETDLAKELFRVKSELDKAKKIISDYACYGDSRIMRDQAISFAKRVLKDKR